MPLNLILSMGGKSLDRTQIIDEIKKESEDGEFFVKMHMDFLRSFKNEI
jgi:hypothetical protein